MHLIVHLFLSISLVMSSSFKLIHCAIFTSPLQRFLVPIFLFGTTPIPIQKSLNACLVVNKVTFVVRIPTIGNQRLFFLAIAIGVNAASWSVAFNNEQGGDGSNGSNTSEEPPGGDDVASLDADAKDGAGEGGSNGTTEATEGGGEAVERAEDADRSGRVGEHDGGAGEGNDDRNAFDEHESEEDHVPMERVLDQGRERCKKVYHREYHG